MQINFGSDENFIFWQLQKKKIILQKLDKAQQKENHQNQANEEKSSNHKMWFVKNI